MFEDTDVGTLEITLSFTRKTGKNEWDDYHHSFTSNESLDPVLENIEAFLKRMGFEINRLENVKEEKVLDFSEEPRYNGNVIWIPTPREED